MFKLLTIAGSDSSGGAGIQADLKTFCAHGVYGMSVITAITAQNTQGVFGVVEAGKEMVEKQLDAIFDDIVPDSIKIGMLSSKDIVIAVAEKLIQYKGKNIVLDPVMVSTSGHSLISPDTSQVIVEKLFPLASVITPNLPEAEVLSSIKIRNENDLLRAGEVLLEMTKGSVLIKGGHFTGENSTDYLFLKDGRVEKFTLERINSKNTHGTGCTLSSAIACNLAQNFKVEDAVKRAKDYVYGAILHNPDLGKGSGPLNHLWNVTNK